MSKVLCHSKSVVFGKFYEICIKFFTLLHARGENGPTAYIVEKIDDTTCKFTWLLNVDLKGWLPQYLINSSLASAQLTLIESLRNYLSKTVDITSSFSSSTGDLTS
ncbi:unnamed protein product [Adineta steineri]|uniref:START domain-containing protein n=1 Tax=Adineta steineri TaxID=433720 RepID=A0A814NNS0_9BILA|nr:unnamed protein product [Adineta steineri]